MSKQKSLVNCGFTVKSKTNEDISSHYSSVEVNYKKYRSCALIDDINERTAFARYLFRSNKKSDEYYTRSETWKRFIIEKGLMGKTVFEPFYGDGSSRQVLSGLVDVVGEQKDFWEQIKDPNCPQDLILSNPQFSFKWLLIQTLLENKRDFALILSWEAFYDKKCPNRKLQYECPLKLYKTKFGGDYEVFKLKINEQQCWSPKKKEFIRIGVIILYWKF